MGKDIPLSSVSLADCSVIVKIRISTCKYAKFNVSFRVTSTCFWYRTRCLDEIWQRAEAVLLAQLIASMALPALLPHQADVIVAILEAAHADEPSISLVDVLRSYEAVLRKHGVDPAADTFFYRFILQLSLNPSPTFWHKLDDELKVRA